MVWQFFCEMWVPDFGRSTDCCHCHNDDFDLCVDCGPKCEDSDHPPMKVCGGGKWYLVSCDIIPPVYHEAKSYHVEPTCTRRPNSQARLRISSYYGAIIPERVIRWFATVYTDLPGFLETLQNIPLEMVLLSCARDDSGQAYPASSDSWS